MEPSSNHPSMWRPLRQGIPVLDWSYHPEPPFTVQFFPEDSGTQPVIEDAVTLEDAIHLFFDFGIPARYGWYGNIIDANGRLVLAWMLNHDSVHKFGPDGLWMGVGEVFIYMEQNAIPNIVDPQLWSDQARGNRW